MAYAYADYETKTTNALKLAALNLHIAEVSLKVGPSVSADGISRDAAALVDYLAALQKRRAELEALAGVNAGGVSNVRFTRPT